ncbi:MAG: tRNA pseudouridine(55) synthase TruB [Gemmatimonadota bacterium]|nr:tRNA pseudouridine(55) synthase TruB [Gemmatimonadota bacterium]
MIVDKPAGPTSHDVVALVRRATGIRRVGHAGTLDPFASGVLPVLIGRATRLVRFLVGLAKQYAGTVRLGITTDTDDRTGAVLRVDEGWRTVSESALEAAMTSLTGSQAQVPPVYSAKKVAGVPAHRRVRRGQSVTLAPRPVSVAMFRCTGRDGPDVHFTAAVSSGTYVRALARDLGERLGCGAHLLELRRTAVGPWDETDAIALDRLIPPFTAHPPLTAVQHLPHRPLDPTEVDAVRHGRPVQAGDAPAGPTALLDGGALLAVAERRADLLVPCVVLDG